MSYKVYIIWYKFGFRYYECIMNITCNNYVNVKHDEYFELKIN